MRNGVVCLVAFTEQDNMGVGYIASVLLQHEFRPFIVDFRLGKERILSEIAAAAPLAVGFSIIFQHHILDFRSLIRYLREGGIRAHFCAGGHYPSLRYRELLETIPELDSVVLFEGEHTFLELVQCLGADALRWRGIEGIAYVRDGMPVANALRPLESDLDAFPPPVRGPTPFHVLGQKYATVLAGRGCLYDCAFCSIREFYSKPPGPVKRVRRPDMVVREMELLNAERDCTLFMFQDDDFPVAHLRGEWIAEFCHRLEATGMANRILWKISCRSDEVKPELFRTMHQAGLFLVYLGIESGTNEGLALMRKHITPEFNIAAVNTLNQLGIAWDFGFMLFDPASTWCSIRANLDFLETICADGSSPVTFCKMLPYAETKIEADLKRSGRLKRPTGFADYDFLDPSLNSFFDFVSGCFGEWIARYDGVLNCARWAHYYPPVCRRFFPATPGLDEFEQTIRRLISDSNRFLLLRLRESAAAFENGTESPALQRSMRAKVAAAETRYRREFEALYKRIKAAAVPCHTI